MQAEPLKHKRRWLQFSLRTLLLAVAIAAATSGWLVHRDRVERRTAAKIRALENRVAFCDQTYAKVRALFDVMAKGGEANTVSAVERDMWLAHAELALARGEKAQAIEELKKALRAADQCVIESWGALSDLRIDLGAISAADEKRCQIEVQLADLAPEVVDELRQVKK